MENINLELVTKVLAGLLIVCSLFLVFRALRYAVLGLVIGGLAYAVFFVGSPLQAKEGSDRIMSIKLFEKCPTEIFRTTDYVALEGTGDNVFYVGTKKFFICMNK